MINQKVKLYQNINTISKRGTYLGDKICLQLKNIKKKLASFELGNQIKKNKHKEYKKNLNNIS